MTDIATSRAAASEVALLRALVQEQLAQITDLTQQLALAQLGATADPDVLRASIEALERRLEDARDLALAREATLAAQILADGTALLALAVERDDAARTLDQQRQEAEQRLSDLTRQITALEGERHAVRAEASALRLDLDRIYASHSWRLTEPLRAGRRLLGGG